MSGTFGDLGREGTWVWCTKSLNTGGRRAGQEACWWPAAWGWPPQGGRANQNCPRALARCPASSVRSPPSLGRRSLGRRFGRRHRPAVTRTAVPTPALFLGFPFNSQIPEL